jgi:SDR family mycofactocin-dependent oxidoreductase
MGKLEGKVALITGAARGQGRSHARMLAAEGADIIAIDACAPNASVAYPMPTLTDLHETAATVEAEGRRVVAAQVDTRDYEALKAVVDEAVSALGGLDIVVANAGVFPFGDQLNILSDASWEAALGVNLTGTWHTCKAAAGHLIDQGRGGAVVIASSTAGLHGSPRAGAYSVSKHGIKGLMETLALELGPHGIRVNSVIPTAVPTPMCHNDQIFRAFLPTVDSPTQEQIVEVFTGVHALPIPWVEPEDVSKAIIFLTSDDARYITGTELKVDGGFTIK